MVKRQTRLLSPDAYKRRAYLVGLSFGVVVCLLALTMGEADPDPFRRLALPFVTLWLILLTIGFWREKKTLRPLEIALFSSMTLYFLLRLGISYLTLGAAEAAREFAGLGYWFPTLYAMAFLMFGARHGTRVSLLVYALTVLIGGIGVISQLIAGNAPREFFALVQMYGSSGILILVFITFSKLTEIHTGLASAMEYLAHTDPLTKISNRRRLESLLNEEKARAERYGGRFSVILLDIDHFKAVNDRYGHNAGDQCLRELASLLRSELRSVDHAGRWGGEEFLIILPEAGLEEAMKSALRLNAMVAGREFAQVGQLTASFGVAKFRRGDSLEELVARADKALYQAKNDGRNAVRGAA